MRHINYLVLLLVACSVGACSSPKNDTKDAYPMFWTWLDYQPGMNFDSICTIMNEAGIDGVMLNAPTPDDYRAAIPIAQKHGIEVYAWLWTMNPEHDRDAILKEHPEWFSVNRNGQSLADTTAYVDYYKFMCPALPEVREFIKKKIKECDNEKYYYELIEELEQLVYLESTRQNREFYIMIFIKDTEEKESIKRTLFRSQNIAVQLIPLDLEKKLKILFKLNNPNTKLM